MAAHWHTLTLEELIRLAEVRPLVSSHESLYGTEEGTRQLTWADKKEANVDRPPKAEVQDDLHSYVILRWCPWYSRTFGAVSEADLNALTVKLLARTAESNKSRASLELLTGVTLVLTQPNIPHLPKHPNSTLARTSLFRI